MIYIIKQNKMRKISSSLDKRKNISYIKYENDLKNQYIKLKIK